MIAKNHRYALLVVAALLVMPSLTWGSGFALFEHSNRAMAMGGAFTAVADDPSALFWNPAGMAFQTDKGIQVMFGVTLIAPEQTFYGESPYPGEGYTADLVDQTFPPAHLYVGIPVNDRLEVGFSVTNPWGLGTEWDDDFLGRYISRKADLMNFDLGVSMAYQLSEKFAFGIGVDYVMSTLEIERTVGLINPFNQQLTDVADAKMGSTGINSGFAWNVGLLWKIGGGFTLGGVYRSGFTIDYEGDGEFNQVLTGYPEFDAVIASFLPVDEKVPITTSIEYPDFWTIGLSWQNEKWTLSGQYGVMGWTSFDELAIIFPENPELSSVVPENFEDAAQYRIGGEYRASQHVALQLGYLFDETGQPIESMSPLLADGDRTGYSAGFSYYTDRFRLDLGYLYITNDGRSTEGGSYDGYNGRYDDSKAHLAGATFTIKF